MVVSLQKSYREAFVWVDKIDLFLNRDCLVYREVQGLESDQLKSYFNPITWVTFLLGTSPHLFLLLLRLVLFLFCEGTSTVISWPTVFGCVT